MSWAHAGVRCWIDAKDNQPPPNHLCHLNSSKVSEGSRAVRVVTLAMNIPFPLQEALRDSILREPSLTPSAGSFQNVVNLSLNTLENRRRCSSTNTPQSACHVLLLVRPSSIIQGTQTNSLAVLNERGARENLRAGFPMDRKPYASHYDYEDASDLEEDDDEDILDDEPASAPQVVSEKPRNDDAVVLERSDAKSHESPDTIPVSDLDSMFCKLGPTLSLARHTRVKRTRVATDPTWPIQVQHYRGTV